MSAPPPALFDVEACRGAPPPGARLREIAKKVGKRRTPSPGKRTKTVEDEAVMDRLRAMGLDLAAHFRLAFKVLEAERDGVNGHYGICWRDGTIRIRLRHAVTGKLLKESSLVDTLCHELAHLRHFDHSPRFRRLYERILDEARGRGYYRPGPGERPLGVRQLMLFGDWGCPLDGGRATRARTS